MPNYIFPKLTNNDQFEYMVIDLYQAKYPNAKVEKYGRQGQKQYGIDITIQGNIEGQQRLWCIQCKNYDKLTPSDVDTILGGCTFYTEVQPFDKLIIATFAPNDANVVKHVLEIRASGKYPFDIEYVPQDKICDYIEANISVFKKYYGSLTQQDTLQTECLAILAKHQIEAFLRIEPLTEGLSENIPIIVDECCAEIQALLDRNLARKSDRLYNIIVELRAWLDSYNGSLSVMLFPVFYEKQSGGHFTRFMYLPPENGPDSKYGEKAETVLEYRKHLVELINKIATYTANAELQYSQGSNTQSSSFLTADEAVHDLTLALLYLQRITNNSSNNSNNSASPSHYWDVTGFEAATSYDSEIMGWLQEVGFVSNYKHFSTVSTTKHLLKNNSAETERAEHHVIVTKAGVLRAREILQKLGIQDWNKAEILADADHSASKKR